MLKSPSGGHNHAEDDHDHTSEELNADELNQYDPHVWTSPVNAKIMVQNILQTLCEVDPDNALIIILRTQTTIYPNWIS